VNPRHATQPQSCERVERATERIGEQFVGESVTALVRGECVGQKRRISRAASGETFEQ
jgi:hypothetical protein